MKKSYSDFIELMFAYVVIFFILREWLLPVMELTNTGLLSLFLVFIGLSLALSLFEVHPLLSGLVKVVYISWFLVVTYSDSPFFSLETMQFLFGELKWNITAAFSGDFGQISDAFKTVLFLVLIWMLVYLIHHWITVRMNIFYFFALTVFFIATLDTFSEYDGSDAIVKVVILGLIMTGVLFVKRLMMKTDVTYDLLAKWKILVPMVVMVIVVSVVALFLPKAGPTWTDPVPFIKSVIGQDGGGGQQQKAGYGEDDSQLGGPFVGDSEVVFNAYSKDKHYWRIETKDTYTSKGWIQSTERVDDFVSYENGEEIEGSLTTGNDINNRKQVNIEMIKTLPVILQTYGLKSIATDNENILYLRNLQSEKIQANLFGVQQSLSNYTIDYDKPVYSLEQLHSSTFEMYKTLDISLDHYLQLPETLPQRVKDLALDVTKEFTSVYEKVKAVENYFDHGGFTYNTNEVATPGENQDYVDQFLFDTKIGYCDNFSTSMVVMLRSMGIPARWVKGFSPGEMGPKTDDYRKYIVTNDNAHSWVEAYIPGSGWMEFEPTIGFSNNININYDIERSEDRLLEQPKPKKPETKETPKNSEEKGKRETDTNAFSNAWKWLMDHPVIWWILGALLVVLVLALFVSRRKWVPRMYVRSYRKKEANWSNFEASYSVLIMQLLHVGLRREEGETLRAFAIRVDKVLETDDMKKLTDVYEQHIYGKQPIDVDFEDMKESWENLINRTIG